MGRSERHPAFSIPVNLSPGSTLNSNLRNWILTQEQRFQLNLTQNGLASLETLDVVITQDQGIEIPVKVRRFKPESGDTTGWSWRDSNCQERVMEMPPFYICNVEEAAQNMRRAVVSEKAEYVNFFHGAANPIIRKTFEAAFRYLETSSVRVFFPASCPATPRSLLVTNIAERPRIRLFNILGRDTFDRTAMANLPWQPSWLRTPI